MDYLDMAFDTTGVADVDGDGWVDFLITSAYSMRLGFRARAAHPDRRQQAGTLPRAPS